MSGNQGLKKTRSVYAFKLQLLRLANDKTNVEIAWNRNFMKDVFAELSNLAEANRVEDDPNSEWFFYYNMHNINEQQTDNEDCIVAEFHSVRHDVKTPLKRRSTLTERDNPKNNDEDERRSVHLYMRLKDGLCLLSYDPTRVITANRLANYFRKYASAAFNHYDIQMIRFDPLVSHKFIEKINDFKVIRLASIRWSIAPNGKYDPSDAIGFLQNEAQTVGATQTELVIRHPYAAKNGLNPSKLRSMLAQLMNKGEVLEGRIEGTNKHDDKDEAKFTGIQEKHTPRLPVDPNTKEILREHMFGAMMAIGNDHP